MWDSLHVLYRQYQMSLIFKFMAVNEETSWSRAGLRTDFSSFCFFVQLLSLKDLAERLKKQLSREKSKSVQTRLKTLIQRRHRIRDLAVQHREELELHRALGIFRRDASQVPAVLCSLSSEVYPIFRCYHL